MVKTWDKLLPTPILSALAILSARAGHYSPYPRGNSLKLGSCADYGLGQAKDLMRRCVSHPSLGFPLVLTAAKPQIEAPLQRPVYLVSYTAPGNIADQKTSPLLSTSLYTHTHTHAHIPHTHTTTHTHTKHTSHDTETHTTTNIYMHIYIYIYLIYLTP